MEKESKKKKEKVNGTKRIETVLIVVLILAISLISFVGIYVEDKNTMVNKIKGYELGMDLYGYRDIHIKVDDSTETKEYDENGNLVEDDHDHDAEVTEEITEEETEEGNTTTVEEPINSPELLTSENFNTVKEILAKRLEYMNVRNYVIKLDEVTGDIVLQVPENSYTDYLAQYAVTKGEFKISDNDTEEVLLTNDDVKKATVQYTNSSLGTSVYLLIQFDKEGTEKLKEISKTYIKTTDEEGNSTTKNVDLSIDDETIISTYFEEEITDGVIQLSIGTSSDYTQVQSNLQQASNIAVFLNSKSMPITYEMEINRFVYSDITQNTINIILIVFSVISLIIAIAIIVRYKGQGLLSVIINIGYMAVLLLAIRYANITITLAGIAGLALAEVLQIVLITKILKINKENADNEVRKKKVLKFVGKYSLELIPILIMATVFSVIKWEEIASIGMVLYWGIIVAAIYNSIIIWRLWMGKKQSN